jgi:predicted DNA-binding ribbon-helix-helix protein
MTVNVTELTDCATLHQSSGLMFDRTTGQTSLIARNVRIHGHRTSMRLEPEFWMALREVARREGRTIADVCSRAAQDCPGSVTSAVRVYVLKALTRA